ncbi:hypothetical protein PGT21_023598 [Puccinia graminis f. sp. tritici]|uniref:Uncharacterized protein n=1 Tax=Puccinia graminis f. sp. tritici TaxID=56615 RepID=A0A5B0R7Q6_PUCGR|nr:hypothetical protein PGT21_023598 [Puccinia graminis f. sp. tritici]KAA1121025.1 hypothetical protein PGTUg99_027711 [Puccinia graminis f. sp. tritici]
MSEGESGQNSVYGTLRLESGLDDKNQSQTNTHCNRDGGHAPRFTEAVPTKTNTKNKRHFRPFRSSHQDLLGCEARVPGRHVTGSSPPRLFLLLQSKKGPMS